MGAKFKNSKCKGPEIGESAAQSKEHGKASRVINREMRQKGQLGPAAGPWRLEVALGSQQTPSTGFEQRDDRFLFAF